MAVTSASLFTFTKAVVVHASYTTGIREMILAKLQDVQIHSPNGKKLNKLQKGLNLVVMKNGTIRKIIIK